MDNNCLYFININSVSNDNYDKFYSLVDEERRNRVDKYLNENDKKLSLCSGMLLKYALDKLGIKEYELTYNEYGKPYLVGNRYYFNISHSKDYAMCVVSDDEIGCDIEYIRDFNMKIPQRYFSNEEYEDILIDSSRSKDKFYRYWTLKESFIKNVGLGLSLSLNSFRIILNNNIEIKQSINDNNYYFEEVNIDNNYKCSICKRNNKKIELIEVSL